jgi:uncharacterized protein
MDMYTLRVTRVPENGTLKEKALALSLDELGLGEPFEAPGATVSYELTRMMGKVFGKVQAQARAKQLCGKCLVEYSQALQADFSVSFEPRPEAGRQHGPVEEVDVDDASLLLAYFDGEEIPLGEELRQELELQLPFTPRCRKDCKGLCSQCGQDLNQADCGHQQGAGSGHFDALREIFTRKKEA